jgi:hypothetical protein
MEEVTVNPQMAATALAGNQIPQSTEAAASSVPIKINGVSGAIFQITLVVTTKLMTERLLQSRILFLSAK